MPLLAKDKGSSLNVPKSAQVLPMVGSGSRAGETTGEMRQTSRPWEDDDYPSPERVIADVAQFIGLCAGAIGVVYVVIAILTAFGLHLDFGFQTD